MVLSELVEQAKSVILYQTKKKKQQQKLANPCFHKDFNSVNSVCNCSVLEPSRALKQMAKLFNHNRRLSEEPGNSM